MDRATEMLKRARMRTTKPRLAVLGAFYSSPKPLSAEQIFRQLGKRSDLVTVYRAIALFEKAGLIRSVDLRKDSQYYERADSKHHHHIVCNICGKVEDFESCAVDDTVGAVLKKSSFASIDAHSFELFGTCKTCTKK